MFKYLIEVDYLLFRLINQQWHHPVTDFLMPFIRNPYFWGPVYLFLLLSIFNYFPKQAWKISLIILLTFAATDLISTQVFKTFIERPRPCWDWAALSRPRMLIPCSTGFSFVSSHAANHVGLSTFLFFSIKKLSGKTYFSLYAWALLICYAQLYVGAHYPSDVLGGAVLGFTIGILAARLIKPERIDLSPQ